MYYFPVSAGTLKTKQLKKNMYNYFFHIYQYIEINTGERQLIGPGILESRSETCDLIRDVFNLKGRVRPDNDIRPIL
jgi:hypothetical protein